MLSPVLAIICVPVLESGDGPLSNRAVPSPVAVNPLTKKLICVGLSKFLLMAMMREVARSFVQRVHPIESASCLPLQRFPI